MKPPKEWRGKTRCCERDSVLIDVYRKRGGGALIHNGLPKATVNKATMAHSLAIGGNKLKTRILMSPEVLGKLYKAGTAIPETVRHEKNGKTDRNKRNWEKCWHVVGNAKVNNKIFRYDFTVAILKNRTANIYDFGIKKSK